MTKLLRLPDVLENTTLSRTGLYTLINRGEFPKPVKLGERAVAWRDDQVQAWIDARTPQPAQD